jgi:hypothetical protein
MAILSELSDSDLEMLTMALAALERLADQAASSLGLERQLGRGGCSLLD